MQDLELFQAWPVIDDGNTIKTGAHATGTSKVPPHVGTDTIGEIVLTNDDEVSRKKISDPNDNWRPNAKPSMERSTQKNVVRKGKARVTPSENDVPVVDTFFDIRTEFPTCRVGGHQFSPKRA
ncbi:hypothetical protein V1477_006763 [Vespula maculifrons]|uniref:Uncharacterized protein n=1 Tax=Vespula maculifrons TaxID=7453 RepID=A0ABD2CGM2_VESMC